MTTPAEWIMSGVANYFVDYFIHDFIAVMPILVGVSIGVYALTAMISKTLAKLGVISVFIYGALVVIA